MKQIYFTLSLLTLIAFKSFGQPLTEDANGVLNTGRIVAQTSVGQTFFVGHQLGTGYSYPSSGIFRAWTDNPNGVANYFYDGLLNGATTYSIRADGQGYFAGNVGIGTTTPQQKFAVSNNGAEGLEVYLTQPTGVVGLQSYNRAISSYSKMQFDASQFAFMEGSMGINTTDTKGYTLAVNGSAIATSITVKLYTNWPDYVFNPTYQLPSLEDVKTYINQNHHLPDMPSAQEVEINGLNLGEINKDLVKKVEELTLYLIEKDKKEKEQESINQSLQGQITLLIKQVTELSKIKN